MFFEYLNDHTRPEKSDENMRRGESKQDKCKQGGQTSVQNCRAWIKNCVLTPYYDHVLGCGSALNIFKTTL